MSQPLAVDFGQGVEDAWVTVAEFVPKFLVFLVILIVGYVVARALQKATDAVLERVGFDQAVERGGVRKALARSKYDASDLVAKLVYYAVVLFTLVTAFGIFGPNPISDLLNGVVAFLPKLVVAIIIVVVVSAIASAVKDIISNTLGGLSYGRTLANIASFFILGLGIIAALTQIGIAVTVTSSLLIAVLATLSGILIVGVGGGLIRPMQQRWESYLSTAEQETSTIRQQVQANRPSTPGAAPYSSSTGSTYASDPLASPYGTTDGPTGGATRL